MDEHRKLRAVIYGRYGYEFQDAREVFDTGAAERWGRAYEWYLRGWLPEQHDAVIGDLACGHGKLLRFFKQRGYTGLTGVDISGDQVSLARQIVAEVEESDVLDWLVPRGKQFDVLIALDLIEHFRREEALRFLDLCWEALKPGGRLVLQTPNADSPFALQQRYGDITHEWAFNVNQLARLMTRAKFAGIEARGLGPVPWGYSLSSTARWLLWSGIRAGLQLWNLAETGTRVPVLTRVFLITGLRG
jgi:2-polyprenyl-3-methyl-5-hydroxy-6-metoxy-1,4-benzoquinol methylase